MSSEWIEAVAVWIYLRTSKALEATAQIANG